MAQQQPIDLLRTLLDAAWRRRKIFFWTMFLAIPASIAVALFAPRTHMARSLLLVKISEGERLASRSLSFNLQRIDEQVGSLNALLRSRRVLKSTLSDILGPNLPSDPKDLALEMRRLERSVTIESAGGDFIGIRMRGNQPEGLGRSLEAFIGRLLEAHASPDPAAVNASTVLLTRGREDLEAARRALSEFDQRSRARSQASPSTQEQAEENRRLQDERLLLERQVRRAEQFYKAYVDRHASMGTDQDTHTSNPSQGLLNPPQGFMIIDAPNDPQVAENSRFLIAAVVFAAFTILALVMAVIAELLDTRIRRPEELTALTALPVLARLPRASSDGSAHAPSYSTSGRPAAS